MNTEDSILNRAGSPVRPTTILEPLRLSERLGAKVRLASETFQHTGSFKFRAAFNVTASVKQNLLIAASSGNFGQALAYACQLLGKSCIIVMPKNSAEVKVNAVREFGGQVEFVDITKKSREARVNELAREHSDAYIASAYDDPLIIEGNSSLGRELRVLKQLDTVVVPVGGGGLMSGIVKGLEGSGVSVIGAEPLMANDAAQSLRTGEIVRNNNEPQTIADGARTVSLGRHNWEIIRKSVSTIVEVPEGMITEALRLLFTVANLKVEPTGALAVAAVMMAPELFRGRSVCCVISGGNVDPAVYARILTENTEVPR
jgi:threo-3-hydroxy-L-aspartate ammonia-lyase